MEQPVVATKTGKKGAPSAIAAPLPCLYSYGLCTYSRCSYKGRLPGLVTAWAMRAAWAPLASLAPPLRTGCSVNARNQKCELLTEIVA